MDPANIEYGYEAMLDAQRIGDWTSSLEFADAVGKRSADYKEVRFGRGFALQMLGRTQDALTEYQAVLRRDANHVQVNFNSGYALMSSGRCAEAIPYYEHALRGRPDYAEARLHLESCRHRSRSMMNDANPTGVPPVDRAGTPAPQESATRQLPSNRVR
jgi:tetratricopeptide (TPR) repeat protein